MGTSYRPHHSFLKTGATAFNGWLGRVTVNPAYSSAMAPRMFGVLRPKMILAMARLPRNSMRGRRRELNQLAVSELIESDLSGRRPARRNA